MKNTMHKKIYHREILSTMATYDEILLENCWTLFQNLANTEEPSVVEAAIYFVCTYDFDVDFLPDLLHDCVVNELGKMAKEAYHDSEAEGLRDKREA